MKTAVAPVLKQQACHASQAPTAQSALVSCESTNRSPTIRFAHKPTQPYCTRGRPRSFVFGQSDAEILTNPTISFRCIFDTKLLA